MKINLSDKTQNKNSDIVWTLLNMSRFVVKQLLSFVVFSMRRWGLLYGSLWYRKFYKTSFILSQRRSPQKVSRWSPHPSQLYHCPFTTSGNQLRSAQLPSGSLITSQTSLKGLIQVWAASWCLKGLISLSHIMFQIFLTSYYFWGNRPLLLECILGGDLQHMQVAENCPDSAVSLAHKHCWGLVISIL